MQKPVIVWFRRDLRLDDQPALSMASASGRPIIPVFIWGPEEERGWPLGRASRWWLGRSLSSLDESLRKKKSRLIVRGEASFQDGASLGSLGALADETGADALFYSRTYLPSDRRREDAVEEEMARRGVPVHALEGSLLLEPSALRTSSGTPYRVFTPFWNRLLARGDIPDPVSPPTELASPAVWPESIPLTRLGFEAPAAPEANGAPDAAGAPDATEAPDSQDAPEGASYPKYWRPGEAAALDALERFLDGSMERYPEARDVPAAPGTSRLSPHLHFGEISPRRIWFEVLRREKEMTATPTGREAMAFLRQIAWRDFAHHQLFHFPHTTERPLKEEFERFPWKTGGREVEAWKAGQTGYPLVDAGMRELKETGWMHNRVRMVAASFLVKHLLVTWTEGARWFWETLVDADLANNSLGWQWVAGCGADAAPFFRIFHPVSQGKKHDPEGDYVRLWVPELRRLPARHIHQPWRAPEEALKKAGVVLGRTYPHPIVDHAAARARALEAYGTMRGRDEIREGAQS